MHGFGANINSVTVAGQPHVDADDQALALQDRAAMLLAGPAATAAFHGWFTTLFTDELADYFARVDAVVMGHCDECRAALIATVLANQHGRDRGEIFRAAERRANDLVRQPPARAAIRALAEQLIEKQTLSGAEAHLTLGRFIPFGAFADTQSR